MKRQLTLAIGAALLGASSAAFAITDSEANPTFPLSFANPGARSMGMGGAFLGLADDATAAYANPAGITQLVTPEISIEARHTNYSLPFINGGNATSSPFNAAGLQTANADSSINNLSFLSIVYPHDRWSFAFYRDETLNFHTSYASDLNGEGVDEGNTGVVFPISVNANLKIINYGFSAAWRVSEQLSLGAGLSYYDFHINTVSSAKSPIFGGIVTNPGVPVNSQAQFGSDQAFGANFGARFVLNEQWSAGLVYRRGPKFSYAANNKGVNDSLIFNDDGTITFVPTPGGGSSFDLRNVRFKVPDVYGAGLSWHPTDALVVNFDTDYVEYSQLTRGIQTLFGNDPAIVSHLSIPNGAEIHLGGEYTFTQMTHPFSIRAGVWHDPRHSIEFKGDPGSDLGALPLAVLFAGTKGSQNHGALGLGWAFSKFQIDAAADFSDLTDIYSISAVYRF